MSWQQRIGCRIPARVIGAVQDATEFVGIFTENDVEFITAFGLKNFALVMLADGGDAIGENDAPFQEIETPEKFDSTKREKALRQIGKGEVEPPKTSLLSESMNRQDSGKRQIVRLDIDRDERGCPIVHMQNLRGRGQAPRQFDGGLVEKDKTSGVVFVGDAMFSVNFSAIEKFVATNKKSLYPPRGPAFQIFRDVIFFA